MNITKTPAFRTMVRLMESCGPFHPNPKINELYISLRILGFSEENTKKAINKKVRELVTPNK